MRCQAVEGKALTLALIWGVFRDHFTGGEGYTPDQPMQGDCWTFPEQGWPVLRVHPVHLLDDDDLACVEIWRAWRGDGAGNGRLLPFAGGSAQQPAALMSALRHMDAAFAEMIPKAK